MQSKTEHNTTMAQIPKSSKSPTPYRQIRAIYDETIIIVYQAYSQNIATAAVKEQKLHASSDFSFTRMTWIKPSWCWIMYRSRYSTKDSRQSRILAIKMRREDFERLLGMAVVTEGEKLRKEVCCFFWVIFGKRTGSDADGTQERERPVRVQWDPERGPSLEVYVVFTLEMGY